MCTDVLTYDKEFSIESDSLSQFKLLQLADRWGVKYPSDPILSSVITLWKIFFAIEDNDQLTNSPLECPARKY